MPPRASPSRAVSFAVLVAANAIGAQPALIPALPHPVTNNAVASGSIGSRWHLFSFLGVDSSRSWSGITREAFAYDDQSATWRALPDVPGPRGRLAATAQVARGRVYLFGGYTVDSNATEQSLDHVDVFDPKLGNWTRATPIPTAVDDAVSGVYRDSLIYLISGWHDNDNVRLVQVYDVVHDRWSAGTSIPGAGVFGHSGSMAGNTIVFIDGVTRNEQLPKYRLASQSWIGTVDVAHPEQITWQLLPPHPGPPRYRAAATSCDALVIFAGGTDNPYNFNGIGYNGVPSKPLDSVIAYDTESGTWRTLPSAPSATMDHRALAVRGGLAAVAGGMRDLQRVSASVVQWSLGACRP